ncbi:MAG: tetratricopeptide repeat protein [Candidatus Eisenbacteria bacterium]
MRGGAKPVTVAVLLLLSLLVFLSAFFRINAPDFGWHLMNGKWMAEHRMIRFADPFSYTSEGRSYPPTQWAFEIVSWMIYRKAGVAGIIAAKALLLSLLFFVLGRLLIREGAGLPSVALLLLAGLHLIRFRFIVRPDLVTFLGIALTLSILYDYRRGRRDRLRRLPPLFLLWVQFHSGALFGLLLLGSTWLTEEILDRAWPAGSRLDRKARNRLLLWTVIAGLATLVNPNHVRYATFALGHVEDYAKYAIRELRPLSWELDRSLVLYLGAAAAIGLARIRRDAAALPALFAVGLMAARSVRLFPLYLILSLPILAGALRFDRGFVRTFWTGAATAAALLLAVFAARETGVFGTRDDLYRFGIGVNDRLLPAAGADALERLNPEGNLFNSNLYGGYLIWRFEGRRKVFTDGRSQLHERTLEFVRDHDWEEILGRYGIGHALIDHRWGKPRLPSNDRMRLVWWDDLSMLFVSREEAERRGLPGYEYRYPVEEWPDMFRLDPARVERELTRAVEEAPGAVLPRFLLAFLYSAAGDWARAEPLLAGALEIAPWRKDLRIDHGIALARTGREKEAIVQLRRGLKGDDRNAHGYGWLGNLLQRAGDGKGAERAFRRAIDIEPENPSYPLALGRFYEREGEREKALATYRDLGRRFPDSPEVQKRLEESGVR